MKKNNLMLTLLFSVLVIYSGFGQVKYIQLLGDHTFPESIYKLPDNNILVGGIGDGSIQKIDAQNNVSYFKNPGEDGLMSALGMALDQKTNHLWVLNLNLHTPNGYPGSNIKIFDITTGKLLKTISENFVVGAFFNEIVLDTNGRAYISNTIGPNIYTATFDSKDAEIFVTDSLLSDNDPGQPLNENGLALSRDKKYLIASVMHRFEGGKGRLVRIDIATKSITPITIQTNKASKVFAGSDNMWFYDKKLFMINVYYPAGIIMTGKFNKDYSIVTMSLWNKFDSVYNRPTGSTIRNGSLYTVNSQLNHIVDDKDGKVNTLPVPPFTVVSVPLNELLK